MLLLKRTWACQLVLETVFRSDEEVVSMGVFNTVMNPSEKGIVKGFSA